MGSVERIAEEIIQWIHEDRDLNGLDAVEVTSGTHLMDEGVFDSLKLMEFVAWLEETYGIQVGVEDLTMQFFESPQSVAEGVERLGGGR